MLNLNPYLNKLNRHNPLLFNTILWVVSFCVFLFIFSKGKVPVKIDYIYTAAFLLTLIIPTSLNIYLLLPRLLKKERYFGFVIAFLLNIIIFSQFYYWLFKPCLDLIFPNYYFISYNSNAGLVRLLSIFLIITMLIKLSEDWFYFNQNENRMLKIENQQIQTQLISLRSQINPHFLFNSLNVIYSLAIDKKEEIKDAIVQLSDILRYIIYDTDSEKITLKDEVRLLQNYINFQKFRIHEFQNIHINTDIDDENFQIYPMLLLPLVENSYKHGIKGDLKNTFINIEIKQKIKQLHFRIENNNPVKSTENKMEKHSEVGLKNIRKNLDLIYPNKHRLYITDTKDKFIIDLQINTNN